MNSQSVQVPTWEVDQTPILEIDGHDSLFLLNHVVSALQLENGDVAILNGDPVRLFLVDSRGGLVRQFGRRGGGPGEFRAPEYLTRVDGGSLTVWDNGFGPGYTFDTLGRVVGQSHTDLERLLNALGPDRPSEARIPLPGRGILAILGAGTGRVKDQGASWRASWGDIRYAVIDTSYTVTMTGGGRHNVLAERDRVDGHVDIVAPYIFHYSHAIVSGSPPRLYFSDAKEYRVDQMDLTGRLVLSIRKRGGPRNIDDSLFARMVATVPRKYPQLSASDLAEAWKVLPDQHVYPFILGITVDPEGCVWVRESMNDWSVFSPKGVLIATATIPLFKVFEIGKSYVLGLAVDDDGVETVRSLAITRGRM